MLSSVRLYYIQFIEVKMLWGQGLEAGYEGRGPGFRQPKHLLLQYLKNVDGLIQLIHNNGMLTVFGLSGPRPQ